MYLPYMPSFIIHSTFDAQPFELSFKWIKLNSPVNRHQILWFHIKSDVTTNADSLMFSDIGGVESGQNQGNRLKFL